MLDFYVVSYTFYHNGEEIDQTSSETLCYEFEAKDSKDIFTWENLTEKYHKYALLCPFNIWNQKRGRRVSFLCGWLWGNTADIKEWKHKDLNIEVEIKYHKQKKSLDEIFKWYDSEKAIQYLKERNIPIGG